MKRMFLSMMLAATALCGWADDGDKVLKVKLDIVDFGDSVVVVRGNNQEVFTGKDGKFEFQLTVDSYSRAYMVPPKRLRGDMSDNRVFSVPLVGGEKVVLRQTERSRYDIDGSGFYAEYHKVDLFNEEARKEVLASYEKLQQMEEQQKSDAEIDAYVKDVHMPCAERYIQKLFDYIKAHPKQEAAMTLLDYFNTLERKKEAYALFDSSVQNGRMKAIYDNIIAQEEAKKKRAEEAAKMQEEAARKQAVGIDAPSFTLNDIEGKPLSLSSLRGKYVILDFWGSWCGWCIKGFPKMKEYYSKYAGKFEILGIDCGDTEARWKAAVEKHQLPWLHVYVPEGATITKDYGITGYPTKIIVGPDGKIFKSIIGEDPAFYELLDELFGK